MSKFFCIVFLFLSCCSGVNMEEKFDLQGHRGARGLMPENTIPAFIKAVDLGVTTLELDVVVSGDGQLVVSHEPYMNPQICFDSGRNEISDSVKINYNIYHMSYDEVSRFDCGSKYYPKFPEQEKISIAKPLLKNVIDSAESYTRLKGYRPLNYNIEIKSTEKTDGIFHPDPATFSDLTYEFIKENIPIDRVTIQSFDFRVLQYFHQTYPETTLAILIENCASVESNLVELGFMPQVYSCNFELLTQDNIKWLQERGIKVIPWTVNEVGNMEKLVEWGVDGLITDYPNRFKVNYLHF